MEIYTRFDSDLHVLYMCVFLALIRIVEDGCRNSPSPPATSPTCHAQALASSSRPYPSSVRATFLPTPPAADHLFHDIAEHIVILRGEMKSVIFGKARYLL